MAWSQWMGGSQSFSGETVAVCYSANFSPLPNAQDCSSSGTYSSGTYTADELFPWTVGMGYSFWIGPPGVPGVGEALPAPSGFAGGGGGGSTVVEFGPPFNLSASDGLLVSGAVVGVWLIGFVFRALRGMLSDRGDAEAD